MICMICFTDRCGGLRCTPILKLKSYYEKTKRKNNINKTDLGNYKHLQWRNIINNIDTII